MNENGQKNFEYFGQGEEEVCTVSLARWNAQLEGFCGVRKKVSKHEAGCASIE